MKMTCNLPDHAAVVEALLEGFVLACQVCIEAGLAPADPTMSNVEYKLEGWGEEDWKLPQNVIRDGWGDCEDLAGWRAAGYRATGADPGACVRVAKTGANKLHAVVQRSDGSIEDPSRELRDRKRGWAVLGGGGVQKSQGGGTPSGGSGPFAGLPPAGANPLYPSGGGDDPRHKVVHERVDPTSAFYGRMLKEHPTTEGLQQAMDIRQQYGETAGQAITSTFGKPIASATYSTPESAFNAGINPDTGSRYTSQEMTYIKQGIDPNDPSTWPPFDPNDPNTWGLYGYDPSQGYGGYGGYGDGGGYGYGYGYPGDYSPDPYAGGYPWGTPPEPEDMNPYTDWGGGGDPYADDEGWYT